MSAWMALALGDHRRAAVSRSSRACACSGSPSASGSTFAAGIAVLAASGHAMTARWHLGPIADWYFWWVLVTSPEILVFLFFMITDPKTIPHGRHRRAACTRSGRAAGDAAHRASDDRVRDEGGRARRPRARLRRAPAARMALPRAGPSRAAPRAGLGRLATRDDGAAALAGAVGFVGAARARRAPRALERRATLTPIEAAGRASRR